MQDLATLLSIVSATVVIIMMLAVAMFPIVTLAKPVIAKLCKRSPEPVVVVPYHFGNKRDMN